MIYDCFNFYNEINLLEMRLNILNDYVDKFVLVEAPLTQTGKVKPLYYLERQNMFKNFNSKIIHVVVNDMPQTSNFARDSFQKCATIRGLKKCNVDDIIIFSDIDEIPNPIKITEILKHFDKTKVYHFAQNNCYYFINLREITGNLLSYTGEFDNIKERKWLGTKMCSFSMLTNCTMEELRFPHMKENGVRVENGGWHFSYCGGLASDAYGRINEKLDAFAHQECITENVKNKLHKRILEGQDLFNRNAEFVWEEINEENYPKYICQNTDKYTNMIMPRPTFLKSIKLNIKRKLRMMWRAIYEKAYNVKDNLVHQKKK